MLYQNVIKNTKEDYL